jgi:hypothetical protein
VSAYKVVAENRREIGFDSFKQSLYLLFKSDETPMDKDINDKEIIEERMSQALKLDNPADVKLIM